MIRLLLGEARDAMYFLSEYYNLIMCGHLQVVYQQRLDAVDPAESFATPKFPMRTRLYLKLSSRLTKPFKPIPVRTIKALYS